MSAAKYRVYRYTAHHSQFMKGTEIADRSGVSHKDMKHIVGLWAYNGIDTIVERYDAKSGEWVVYDPNSRSRRNKSGRSMKYTVATVDPMTQRSMSRLGRWVSRREADKIADLWERNGSKNVCVIDERGHFVRQPASSHLPSNRNMSGGGGVSRFKVSDKDPATMSASQINSELEKLNELNSRVTDAFIDAGRGHERPSDYARLRDPLSKQANTISNRRHALYAEVELRAGPGMVRLPSGRGFGARR